MLKDPIKFNVARDFGGVINCTFTFVSQNFKKLLMAIMINAGIFILITAIIGGIIHSGTFSMLAKVGSQGGGGNPGMMFTNLNSIFYLQMLMGLSAWLTQTALMLTVYGYIKLYTERGQSGFEISDIREIVKKDFFHIFIVVIPIGFIIGLAAILLIIPGIYVGIVFSIIFPIIILERKSLGDAISRSFYLVKENWWVTFGIFFIMTVVAGMIYYVFLIPTYVIFFMQSLNGLALTPTIKSLYAVFGSIGYIVLYTVTSVVYISMAIHYYSLVEKKDQPTLLQKIEEIEIN